MRNSKTTFSCRGVARCIFIIPAILIFFISQTINAAENEEPSVDLFGRLDFHAGIIWGEDNIWLPGPGLFVQYEPDLGERSMVDLKSGKACVQILLKADDDSGRQAVLAHLRQGIGNLILREPEDPVEMIKTRDKKNYSSVGEEPGSIEIAPGREIRIYLIEKGDSLWKISRRFGMKTEDLCRLNNFRKEETLQVGQPIKVLIYVSHDLTLDSEPENRSNGPLFLDQIRMVDGSPVSPSMVSNYAGELLENHPPKKKKVTGRDGIERLSVSVEFTLVTNHVEIRARKFYPMVRKQAEKYNIDPAVVMAIIHTESMFNPMARSNTPAYGLMQLVPHGGGLEAYYAMYAESQKLTPQYLYDPENNIELGTAYYNILKNRYMGLIDEPVSRKYCAVAAYNAGASNVGYAFISEKSINLAAPEINRMDSQQVYQKLIEKLPFKESRDYVRKVFTRIKLYRDWN